MKLFSSLRWDGGAGFFYRFKGGGGGFWKILMLERVWKAGLAKTKDQRRTNYRSWPSEGQVTAMEDSP